MTERSLEKYLKDHFPFYFLFCNRDGDIQYCRGAKEIYGITDEELNQINVFELHKKTLIDQESATAEALKTKTPVIKYMTSRINLSMLVYAAPFYDENGEIEGAFSFTFEEMFFNTFVEAINKNKLKLENTIQYLNIKKEAEWFLESANPRMQELYQVAKTAAKSESIISIYGESGTGKEILAHLIHKNSLRVDEPFIPINCAAIPADLIESEFFGYSKHAFTGADAKGKMGLFEMANYGTLFLDEIGELPLAIQSKLLRSIETGEIRRVGDTKLIQTDVRIITATNRNLFDLVQNRQFREDLYYRINVISLGIPSLKERREDILPLAEHLLKQWNMRNRAKRYFSESVSHFFLHHDWPGNIREMKNMIERLCIIAKTDELRIEDSIELDSRLLSAASAYNHLHHEDSGDDSENRAEEESLAKPLIEHDTLRHAVRDFERNYIETAVLQCGGNMTAAAKQLGIHRSQLYKLIDKTRATE